MKRIVLTAACFVLIFSAGCLRSKPSKFYLLHGLENSGTQYTMGRQIKLGVGPVDLPEYLDRPQIVDRVNANEISLSEFNRWAEPLNRCVLRVLAENLSLLLGTEQVALFPWQPSRPIDYQVRVRFERFGGNVGEDVELVAYWSIDRKDGAADLINRKTMISEKAEVEGVDGMVQAQSRALEKLSREIAAALQKIAR